MSISDATSERIQTEALTSSCFLNRRQPAISTAKNHSVHLGHYQWGKYFSLSIKKKLSYLDRLKATAHCCIILIGWNIAIQCCCARDSFVFKHPKHFGSSVGKLCFVSCFYGFSYRLGRISCCHLRCHLKKNQISVTLAMFESC